MLKSEIEQVKEMIDYAIKKATAPLAEEIEKLKVTKKTEPAPPMEGKTEAKK